MMRQRLANYAPYITWLGLLLVVAGLLVPLLVRQSGAEVPAYVAPALVGLGAILALAWPLLRPGDLREVLGGRRARFGANALILTVSVIGILVVVNVFSYLYFTQIDLTSNKQFSISRQTVQILDDLDDQTRTITVTAIVADPATADDFNRLVERYQARTGNITVQRIDPQVDTLQLLGLAQRLELGQSIPARALVAEMGDRHEVIYTGFDEQALTEAIVKVMRAEERRVAFTTGHGEHDPEGGGERSYFSVGQQLEREGYAIETINLATITETLTAETADVLVVAGPRQPFLPDEASAVASYLAGGGSVLLLLDPGVDANLQAVLAPYEIQPHDDVVLQQSAFGLASSVVVQGDDYSFHTITKDLTELQSIFPGTRSLALGTPMTTSLQSSPLIEIDSPAVWGETDLQSQSGETPVLGEDDIPPPLVLAATGEETAGAQDAPEAGLGRIVVFGSSTFVADEVLRQLPPGAVANFDLFLNAVNWLSLEEELVSIRPVEPDDRPVQPPSNPLVLLLTTAVLVPLAVVGTGAYIYWRRH